jgi:hypothetical protein
VIYVLLACLLDPIVIVLGLLIGWFSRRWWQVFAAACAIAVIGELVVNGEPISESSIPRAIGALAWLALAFVINDKRRKARLAKATAAETEA